MRTFVNASRGTHLLPHGRLHAFCTPGQDVDHALALVVEET